MSLPDATSAPDDEMHVEVDARWLGRVRLTFAKYKYSRPKGKCSAVSWHRRHAAAIPKAD